MSDNFRKFRRKALPHREDISFHSLRDTCASWMVQSGVTLYTVQQILGHKDIKTTMKYAHLAPDNFQEAVEVTFNASK